MQNFGRIMSKTMNAEDLQSLAMKKDFEHPGLMRRNLPPGQVPEERTTDLIRNFLLSQLTFGTTKTADLRQCVDARRDILNISIG